MRDVLFVQGAGEDTHAEWDIHLVRSLRRELGAQYRVLYPQMPNEGEPSMAAWRPALEQELESLREGAIVIGHSVGGTMLFHTLLSSASHAALGALFLIAAPFIGDGGWPSDEIKPASDLAARLPASVPVILYHGEDDAIVPVEHVELYAEAIPGAVVRRLPGRDHQLNNDLSAVAGDIRRLEERAGRGWASLSPLP